MTDQADQRAESGGLYVSWDELRRRVAPGLGRDRFKAMIAAKVRDRGFPPFREDWAGFYWPKVREWLDSDNGVGTDVSVTTVEDGPENFDAPPRKKARVQDRPPQAALLDRKAGDARPDGLSGHVYSLAARGKR